MDKEQFFDVDLMESEQIPRLFTITFEEVGTKDKAELKVSFNNIQIGDIINDNSYSNDFYRYHDVFHYSFATLLGWSPCARAMMRCKRKSDSMLDEIEDGARAAITEEAISMIIFNDAKKNGYFKNGSKVSKTTLRIIREMTDNFEVKVRTSSEWESAILKSYEVFRFLIENNGGKVVFDAINKNIEYSLLGN